jgi:SAM-dependent methyltransferase
VTDKNFWEKCYQEGGDRWDLGQAAPPFVTLLESYSAPSKGRMAVLGCGRGYDALLFASYGFEVVGFDFTDAAITDAQNLAKAANSKAKFLQRDIFELPKEFENSFDYVLEHTCFCAINPTQREDYVQVVKSILKPNAKLIGLFFTHNRPGGPPFGVTTDEIKKYFQNDFEINSLVPVTNSIPSRKGEEHLGQLTIKN